MGELIHDLAAGYALDALDADETAEFERHLETCAACRDEVASFAEVGAALAVAAGGPEPPPGLREAVLATVRSEMPAEAATAPPQPGRAPRFRLPRLSLPRLAVPALAVAAAAAAVAIGLGVHASRLSGDLDDTRAALEVLGSPDARDVALQAGNGRLVVDGERAVLVIADVAPAPAGKTYELWIVQGDAFRPAGLFDGSEGDDVVSVQGTVPAGAVVAVTLEDDGGSPTDTPTGTPFVASSPV
ncbi:MAG: anti-sigma factor domain-containing protein [Gaiella sp.]